MELAQITRALQHDAVPVVFFNVLLQQVGLPVPAVPTLLLAGSLVLAPMGLVRILVAAIIASVVADWLWYWAGKLFGYRVLAGLCKLSMNPSSCVSQTEARFIRWGVSSLVVAKFVPGFSTVAPPIAGALRMNPVSFLLAAGAGAGLWAGLALGVGWLLKARVQAVIAALDAHQGGAVAIVALLLGFWLGWKLWQKYRFRKLSAVPFITPHDLLLAMRSDNPPLLLDLRGATMIAEAGPIAGARVAEHDLLRNAVGDWPKHRPVVTLCACPEDAGAIQAARRLQAAGYADTRPVKGGYEAWLAVQRSELDD